MLKIVSIAVVFAIIILYLRNLNAEFALLASIGAGIIVLFYSLEYLTSTFNFINQIVELSGIDREYYKIIFKITAIGYVVEFASSTVNDFGLKSLSDKITFAGKIIIITTALPIFYAVFNLIVGLLLWKDIFYWLFSVLLWLVFFLIIQFLLQMSWLITLTNN